MTKLGDLAEQIQRKKNQALENAKIKHTTPDQLLKEARRAENIDGLRTETSLEPSTTIPLSVSRANQNPPQQPLQGGQNFFNGEQSDNKQVSNGEQSDNKQVSNGEQSDNKQVSNGEQSDNKQVSNGKLNKRTVNKRVSQPITSGLTNGEQSVNKRLTKTSFFQLVGLQRKVTLYVYESCKITRSSTSAPITLEAMSLNLQSPKGSVKTTTNRLREKGVIETVDQKEGRGGFTKYRLDDAIHQEILQHESVNNRITNGEQSDNKRISKPITERVTSPPSSSSSYVLEEFKTTTTDETKSVRNSTLLLSPEWLEIDCSPLSEIHFGQTQLSQIVQIGKLTPVEVQDSVNAFAFDLNKNQKAKSIHGSPLGFFMGILRKGCPYTPPENYESPEDEARRKYLESKRAQLARRQAMEQEITDLEFQEWKERLSTEQRKALAPHAKIDGSEMQISTLREYFLNHVYAQQKIESVETIRRQIDHSLGISEANEGAV